MAGVHQHRGMHLATGTRQPVVEAAELSGTLTELWRMRQADREERRIQFRPWAMRVPEPKTGTLDFSRFPPQKELYDEAAGDKEAVVKKGTQVGVSTFALRWAMYWTDVRGWTGLYVFPKKAQMYDFSDARVKPVIERSEYLRGRVPPGYTQNKGLKQIGLGFVYFRGSESKDDLDSVDADHIVFDEYDRLTHENIPDAEKRIGASQHGLIRRIGIPSVPGWGIDKLYEAGDKRQWMVQCEGCREWQSIDFFENVDQKRVLIVCKQCARPLDVTTGEWVAEHPDRDVRTYHLSRLLIPGVNLAEIIINSRKRTPYERTTFFTKDLGLAWAPEEGRLSDAALAAAQSAGKGYVQQPGYVGHDLVTMGVDVASVRALNVRISRHLDDRRKQALALLTVDSFDDLFPLMDRYGVHMAAIDHLPEGRLARTFAERFPGRVYLVAYKTSTDTPEVLKVNDEERFASVRRIEAIDATLEMVRSQRNQLPLDWPDDYPEQMKALQRVAEKDEVGRQTVRYVATGPDDWAQSEVYDLIATELWHYRQARDEQDRDVFTRLEDSLEFQRAALDDPEEAVAYHEGPEYDGDDEYYAGPEDIEGEYR